MPPVVPTAAKPLARFVSSQILREKKKIYIYIYNRPFSNYKPILNQPGSKLAINVAGLTVVMYN